MMDWLDNFSSTQVQDFTYWTQLIFLDICECHDLVTDLPQFTFFVTLIRWCGRLIDFKGFRMDPSNYEGVGDVSEP